MISPRARHVVRGILLAALALTLPACVLNLGHINALRDAQDQFTELAAQETGLALEAVFPGGGDSRRLIKPPDRNATINPSIPPEQIQGLERGYREISEALDALLRNASGELQSDKLLGSCLTLRVLARWRAVFHAHLLRAFEISQAEPATPSSSIPPSMTSVVALADSVLKELEDKKIEIFPRDRFLLKAMKPLVRYDIAYIRTCADSRLEKIAATERWSRIAKERTREIATADEELVKAAESEPLQVRRYAFLSRLVMLQTGRTLAVLVVREDAWPSELPELTARIKRLQEDYSAESGKPIRDAIKLTPEQLKALFQ